MGTVPPSKNKDQANFGGAVEPWVEAYQTGCLPVCSYQDTWQCHVAGGKAMEYSVQQSEARTDHRDSNQ